MDDRILLDAIAPTAAALFERHLSTARDWFPHELVPWSRARAFEEGYRWEPDVDGPPAAVRSALFVNLLTEDNLPYYFNSLDRMFGSGEVWGEWARRWTAEEGRHAIVIRDYLTVSRTVDPVALERARMAQVSGGITPEPMTVADGLVCVTLQELATRNTGKLLGDRPGYEVMARVAADENLHHLFYRDLTTAALAAAPSAVLCAIDRQVREFRMPGTGIVDFASHAAAIARAGIYDFQIHYEQILVPVVLHHWHVETLEGLDAAGEAARTRLVRHVDRVGVASRRLASRRAETGGTRPSAVPA